VAQISINTQSAQYQNYLTGLRNLKTFYAPRIVEYFNLPEEAQVAWRAADPILNGLLTMAEKITERSNIDDQA